jgi:hypothetical protein
MSTVGANGKGSGRRTHAHTHSQTQPSHNLTRTPVHGHKGASRTRSRAHLPMHPAIVCYLLHYRVHNNAHYPSPNRHNGEGTGQRGKGTCHPGRVTLGTRVLQVPLSLPALFLGVAALADDGALEGAPGAHGSQATVGPTTASALFLTTAQRQGAVWTWAPRRSPCPLSCGPVVRGSDSGRGGDGRRRWAPCSRWQQWHRGVSCSVTFSGGDRCEPAASSGRGQSSPCM